MTFKKSVVDFCIGWDELTTPPQLPPRGSGSPAVRAAGPIPLHGEALLEYYFTLLEAELELDWQRGKLLAYNPLHQGRESPRRYLADTRLHEPHILDSYPKQAIAEQFVDRLDANITDMVIAKFQGRKMEKWYELLDDIAKYADSLWASLSGELHPELTKAGWLPLGVIQHAKFLENQAKGSV